MDTADGYRTPPLAAKQSHISNPQRDMAAYMTDSDRHGLLLEAIADFEKAVASLNRSLPLLRVYRDVEQARRAP